MKQWWGYRHKNGELMLKPCIGLSVYTCIGDALASPYVDTVCGVFSAPNAEAAMEELRKRINKRSS